jgi:hypothetical protein
VKNGVLTESDADDIQGLLDRVLAGGRMILGTENYELDVTAVQLHGSPAGRRHPER